MALVGSLALAGCGTREDLEPVLQTTEPAATNTPPVPVIDGPPNSLLWSVGDTVAFSGHADDAEDGRLPASRLGWTLLLHPCSVLAACPGQTLSTFAGVASGSFRAPDVQYPAYLELQLTATDSSGGSWWDSAWRYRRALTVTGTLPSGTQTDVPVLVKLDSTRIDYTKTLANGADIRFTTETGTPLSYEIEAWNPGGVSVVWVKLPQVVAGGRMFIYYGNPSATSAASPSAVWSNGYAAVWHLGSDLADSTGHGNVGTRSGAVATAGYLGSAHQFDGNSASISVGAGSTLSVATNLSLEAWIKVDDTNTDSYRRIISKKATWDAASGYNLEYNPGLNYVSTLGGGSDYLRATGIDLDTNWHWLATTASGSSGRVYVDGADRTADGALGTITTNTLPVYLGRSQAGEYFKGAIDEVRISSVARSAAWVALQSTSMRDTLLGYGAEEAPSALSATTSVLIYPNTTDLTFETAPVGLALSAGSVTLGTPFVTTQIVGSTLAVVAPPTQPIAGQTYQFVSWSDGGQPTHSVVVNAALSPLRATYALGPTCTDGIKNGNEVGVDCGGNCPPCPLCQAGGCDDGNVCTTDSCDPAAGCLHPAISCDDGNACTTDLCDPMTGCAHGTLDCDDGNVCTTDTCDAATGCAHLPRTARCNDDGDPCTSDVCGNGVCTHPDNGTCTSAPFQESGGMVVFEAEHFHAAVARASHSWNLASNTSASGGQLMTAAPDNGLLVNSGYTTGSPELDFKVAFTTTGTYQVWLRGSGPNADGDSCHAGIDGTAPTTADRITNFTSTLGWSRGTADGPVATIVVSTPGVHTVNLWMREDGFSLDKVLLTTNTGYTPSGTGPAESPRQGSGGCTGAADCNDNNPCTTDTCSAGACQNTPVTNGTACPDDGNVCTNDACTAGICQHPNNSVSCTDDGNPCTTDVCNNGACNHQNNTASCPDDGNACTSDVCASGVCTHPSNNTCSNNTPCSAYCSNPVTFSSSSYQSGNLGTQATCHQTTATLNGGVCGNFASSRTLSVNGKQMTCNNGNWSALPAKVNGGYCITTTAGDQAWAYFSTW